MQNFIAILRKYRLAMAMNFIGLVLAFTAFMALMLQVEYQRGFDRGWPTSGRIYRVDKSGVEKDDIFRNILPRGYVDDILNSSPHIAAGTISCPYTGETVFNTMREDGNFTFRYGCDVVYPGLFEVFGIRFTEGSSDALEDIQKVVIPKSLAVMLYGNESAVGKVLTHDEKYRFGGFRSPELTIGGVYEDFPKNSQFGNRIYMNIGSLNEGTYGGANYTCWVLLDSADSKDIVERNFNDNYDYGESGWWLTDISLTPVEDIYFNEGERASFKSGSRRQMWLMICISILVMLIGGMNYATFFTALAPLRVKSINTRKVFGSSLWKLRASLVAEALGFSVAAFAAASSLISPACSWLYSEGLISMDFDLQRHYGIVAYSALAAVAIGLAGGIYPSIHVTSLPPAFALKGNFAFSASGRRFRITMLVL